MSGTGEDRDYQRVRAYLERKGQVNRTLVLQALGMSAGDVKAIAARMQKEGILRIEENDRGGALYTFLPKGNGKGVTPGPAAPAPAVTPHKTEAMVDGIGLPPENVFLSDENREFFKALVVFTAKAKKLDPAELCILFAEMALNVSRELRAGGSL